MSSSDSDDEPVLRYGTPLEPYDEDEVPAKRRPPATEQVAVDAHGRRRFHGAFTGGFSAGHGNTVGTPEGWTPAAFKSSRTERGAFEARAPEDFMDDEDRGEFGIAPRLIQTQSDFGGKRPHQAKRFHDGPIPGEPVLEQFVRVIPETAAVRLLRAMGWRPGRGVGERRPRRVYGCYVPPEFRQNTEENSDSDGSDVDYEHLFAPEDSEPDRVERKDDRHGLGYAGLSRRSVLGGLAGEYGAGESSVSHLKMKDKGKKVSIRGQAFGVGALEDEDEDVYAREDMSHYDVALGGPAPNLDSGAKKKSDGLEGFVRASRPQPAPRAHPPPALPRDYVPARAGLARTRFEPGDDDYRDRGLGRHELSAEARGALLGEVSAPTDPISVLLGRNINFRTPPPPIRANVLSANKDERIEPEPTQTEPTNAPISVLLGMNVDFSVPPPNFPSISTERDENTESGADGGTFRPFASDAAKQARYELFLRGGAAPGAGAGGGRLAQWEATRELGEFQQAAKLYRPLTGVLKDRFTTGSQADDALNPLVRVERSARADVPEERREAAARGLYGAMTRARAQWRPEPLVCRRFNVPDPYGARPALKTTDKPKTSYSIFEYLEGSIHSKESFTKEQSQFSGSKSIAEKIQPSTSTAPKSLTLPPVKDVSNSKNTIEAAEKLHGNKRMTVADLFLMEADKERQNAAETENVGQVSQTIDKFDKMELYKSIFLSDSEEEENEDGKDGTAPSDVDFVETPMNIERNDSPPRGIFANLDFDQLNSWSSKNKSVDQSQEISQKPHKKSRWENNEDNNSILNSNKPEKEDTARTNLKYGKIIENITGSSKDEDIVELFVSATGGVSKKKQTPGRTKASANNDEPFLSPEVTDIYGPKIPDNLKKNIEKEDIASTNLKDGKIIVNNTGSRDEDIVELFVSATGGVSKRTHTPKINRATMDIDELFLSPKINDNDIYGPKIPENLKKNIEKKATELEKGKITGNACVSLTAYKELDIEEVFLSNSSNIVDKLPRPMYRDKNSRQKKEAEVLEVSSSSDPDAWVDVNVTKTKKQKKKKTKKHKHKSKHKKKER